MPLFSILIPTRERCDTLASSLKTLCGQSFEDVEFIVSDNASEDGTAELVASLTDPRIRYVRTPTRLGMTGNYCFALEHARGEYVSILGDDDGFLPNSLSVLAQWVRQTGVEAITWQLASYYWPNHGQPDRRNRLEISLISGDWNVSSNAALMAAKWGFLRWNYMPNIYGGLVKLDVMKGIKADVGQYINSHAPDVYSAFAISHKIKTYLYTSHPFSTFGFSGKSIASSYHTSWSSGQSDKTDNYGIFLEESAVVSHRNLPGGELRLEGIAILDTLYRISDDYHGGKLSIPFGLWLHRLAQEIRTIKEPLRSQTILRIEEAASLHNQKWLFRLILGGFGAPKDEGDSVRKSLVEYGRLILDCARFGVTDIEGACKVVAQIRPLPGMPAPKRAGFPELLKIRREPRNWNI